ncbi:conserved hypothetical protein [Pediculus humanus corporis]|uniref:Intraflagellar transport protein 20 n=1 Tax=Pediculus humanus subsp. corporis TaxID=121224 RepID=E0V9Y8_PEDHC|nr:uncharacterized protein Phum_PHUM024120 [Pediculus humanus corporis]EEB10194.1 conserved hypothetical protein [Pediculus humanus corporis]
MSSESLEKLGLFFDELNRVRVWEPEAADKTNDLKDECKDFSQKITDFHKISNEFLTSIQNLSKHVEKERIKALGSSNLLKSMAKQRETQRKQYKSLIIEKSTELERLRVQHQSLLKIESEQQDIIDQIQMY